MNDAMQRILQKHEEENRMLAEKLVAFKDSIMESDTFNKNNKKYDGFRFSSFSKTPGLLYFISEKDGASTKEIYYLVMEYGTGSAVKVNISNLEDFYNIEGTNQIVFAWSDKKWFKSTRTETFETPHSEEILQKYIDLHSKTEGE
jgi:hypothetical protein